MIELISKKPEKVKYKHPLFFIHGAWHGAWVWEEFMDYFSERGFISYALSLPGHGKSSIEKKSINYYTFNDYVNFTKNINSFY